jgi:cyclohexanone monooxygenase
MTPTNTVTDGSVTNPFDAIIVGAGFAGMYTLHKLRSLGYAVRVLEAADGVGGTWYWNRYPGARCDVESLDYSYSFDEDLQQEWEWTERFAAQPEILRYANHVADRFDLRRDIQFETRVESMILDEVSNTWTVTTTSGEIMYARHVVMATGNLSAAQLPDIEGMDAFAGEIYHTGRWPHGGVDFTGKRVAVVGTGSSGIQSIPEIAKQAYHLSVFQRTPHFTLPARNAPLDPEFQREFKKTYAQHREQARMTQTGALKFGSGRPASDFTVGEQRNELEKHWAIGGPTLLRAFSDTMVDEKANAVVADFVREKIAERLADSELAQAMTPTTYPIGAKRIVLDTDYYETFGRDNVELVDVRSEPIVRLVPEGIETEGSTRQFDAIVFATGFDAITGALMKIDIRGASGRTLRETWSHGPRAFLGIATHGFPNLWFVTGPGSPSVLTNMVLGIEQHVDWLVDHLEFLRSNGLVRSEATENAQDRWVEHVTEIASATLLPRAESWFVGANIPGKPRVYAMYAAGLGSFRTECDKVAANGYEGFEVE